MKRVLFVKYSVFLRKRCKVNVRWKHENNGFTQCTGGGFKGECRQ